MMNRRSFLGMIGGAAGAQCLPFGELFAASVPLIDDDGMVACVVNFEFEFELLDGKKSEGPKFVSWFAADEKNAIKLQKFGVKIERDRKGRWKIKK